MKYTDEATKVVLSYSTGKRLCTGCMHIIPVWSYPCHIQWSRCSGNATYRLRVGCEGMQRPAWHSWFCVGMLKELTNAVQNASAEQVFPTGMSRTSHLLQLNNTLAQQQATINLAKHSNNTHGALAAIISIKLQPWGRDFATCDIKWSKEFGIGRNIVHSLRAEGKRPEGERSTFQYRDCLTKKKASTAGPASTSWGWNFSELHTHFLTSPQQFQIRHRNWLDLIAAKSGAVQNVQHVFAHFWRWI